jgi:hypothetical protein
MNLIASTLANVTQTSIDDVLSSLWKWQSSATGIPAASTRDLFVEDFQKSRVDGVDGETVGLYGIFDSKMWN